MSNANSKKEVILQAAAEVTMRLGSSAMTLEAVAKEAGVSKGGLLYHFPTKEALIEEMLNLLIKEFDASINNEIQHEIADGGNSLAGRWHRAYVRAAITPPDKIDNLMCSLLVAFTFDPKMMEPMMVISAHWKQMAENDGINFEISKIVRLAADGYWYSRLFKFEDLYGTEEELPALRERLLALIEENVQEPGSTKRSK